MDIQHDTLADYHYAYVAGASTSRRVILLLHGTGGNEDDLIGLGAALDPNAHLLAPRGNVLEGTLPRFFRRLEEGVFDTEDVIRRSETIVTFLRAAQKRYELADCEVVAVGYSNGANIATAILVLHPGVIDSAILLRPMLTIESGSKPSEDSSTNVLIISGTHDPIVSHHSATALCQQLEEFNVNVTHVWEETGHQLTQSDVQQAQSWLKRITENIL